MAEQLIPILYDDGFGLYRLREMVCIFEDCEKMSSWDARNRADKNGFIEKKTNI